MGVVGEGRTRGPELRGLPARGLGGVRYDAAQRGEKVVVVCAASPARNRRRGKLTPFGRASVWTEMAHKEVEAAH